MNTTQEISWITVILWRLCIVYRLLDCGLAAGRRYLGSVWQFPMLINGLACMCYQPTVNTRVLLRSSIWEKVGTLVTQSVCFFKYVCVMWGVSYLGSKRVPSAPNGKNPCLFQSSPNQNLIKKMSRTCPIWGRSKPL